MARQGAARQGEVFLDSQLKTRLLKIHEQIERLYKAEEAHLTLDAAKDHLLATLTANAPLTASSEAAMGRWAKGQDSWLSHRKAMGEAEALFHREKHRLELMMKAFDASYLSMKVEAMAISKGGSIT